MVVDCDSVCVTKRCSWRAWWWWTVTVFLELNVAVGGRGGGGL